jgi:GNAT superfamily N-acetyltransferase
MFRRIALRKGGPWRLYLAHLEGQAVGVASSFQAAGVVGLYFVLTVPQARRQGVATALTWHALQEARRLGYRIAVLGASETAVPLYSRLAFREYCRISLFRSPE